MTKIFVLHRCYSDDEFVFNEFISKGRAIDYLMNTEIDFSDCHIIEGNKLKLKMELNNE